MIKKLFTALAFSTMLATADAKIEVQTTLSDLATFSPSIGVQYGLPKNFAIELNVAESLLPFFREKGQTVSSLIPSINLGARWYKNTDRNGMFAYLGLGYDVTLTGGDDKNSSYNDTPITDPKKEFPSMHKISLQAGIGHRYDMASSVSFSNKIVAEFPLYFYSSNKDISEIILFAGMRTFQTLYNGQLVNESMFHRLLINLKFELLKFEFTVY